MAQVGSKKSILYFFGSNTTSFILNCNIGVLPGREKVADFCKKKKYSEPSPLSPFLLTKKNSILHVQVRYGLFV